MGGSTASLSYPECELSSRGHGIDRVCDEVYEGLTKFSGVRQHPSGAVILPANGDLSLTQPGGEQSKDAVQQFREAYILGRHGIALEAQHLLGDLRHATELGF